MSEETAAEVYRRMRATDPVMKLLDEFLADQPPLLPWQREYLDSVLYGRPMVLCMPRRGGRSRLGELLDKANEKAEERLRALRDKPIDDQILRYWVDEATDFMQAEPAPPDHLMTLCLEHPMLRGHG